MASISTRKKSALRGGFGAVAKIMNTKFSVRFLSRDVKPSEERTHSRFIGALTALDGELFGAD
jgi:hypothetical protein